MAGQQSLQTASVTPAELNSSCRDRSRFVFHSGICVGMDSQSPNWSSTATRRTGRSACNRDAHAGFAAAPLLVRMVFVFESQGSVLCRHGAHVDEPPPKAVWVDKAVRIHEAVILRLVVGRAARGDRFGDKTIYLLTALATKSEQNLGGLARIADGLGREIAKSGVRKQHDKNSVADDDTRAGVVAELRVV